MKSNIRIQMRTFVVCVVSTAMCVLFNQTANANNTSERNLYNSAAIANIIGLDTDTSGSNKNPSPVKGGCRKEGCNVFAEVDKSEQMMYVYVGGELEHTFPVSTGRSTHPTPDLDLRPSGPLYKKYTSTKYPEGDYQGMGNMPYAVFLKGGYAIHGTTTGSIPKLGKKASHGCIRLHPEDAKLFYDLVNSVGLENTWVTVHP